MKLLLITFAFAVSLTVPASAGEVAQVGCKRLVVALAPALSPAIVERDWATGNTHNEPSAILELRGCDGRLLASAPLAAPLAQIDPRPLQGAPAPTFLVSADLTQGAGSYNGPLTIPFEVVGDRLRAVTANNTAGAASPIRLALTGKAAWKRVRVPNGEQILAVNCEPSGKGFTINYRRYRPGPAGWTMRRRSAPGFWESDGAFPASQAFP